MEIEGEEIGSAVKFPASRIVIEAAKRETERVTSATLPQASASMSVQVNAHYQAAAVPQIGANARLRNAEQWQQVANEAYVDQRKWRDNQKDSQQQRLRDDDP